MWVLQTALIALVWSAFGFDVIEEQEKSRRHLDAIASLVISKDLSALDDEYYLDVDPGASITSNADNAFTHASQKLHLGDEMTEEEETNFKARFVEEMEYEADHEGTFKRVSKSSMSAMWKKQVKAALEHQKPIITEAMVKRINSAGKMKARKYKRFENTSQQELDRDLSGELEDDQANSSFTEFDDAFSADLVDMTFDANAHFNPWKKWPKCKDQIDSVRDQV